MSGTAQHISLSRSSSTAVDRWIEALVQWCERLQARRVVRSIPRTLLDWETESHRAVGRFGALNQRVLGVRPIDVRRIAGSVAGASEWDGTFQRRRQDTRERQRSANIVRAMEAGEHLQPITVYKLRRVYYVVDGRHRVGAAKRLGWDTIAANVTVVLPGGDRDENELFRERQRFETATGLLLIEASRPGTYPALLTEIQCYCHDWMSSGASGLTMPDVSMRWYHRSFMPAITLIRGSSARQLAPSLCSADILAYLLAAERRAAGQPVQLSALRPQCASASGA